MADKQQHNFLLEEYKHLTESFLRNEELGERRVNFFIALTGAVVAGLGVIHEVNDAIDIKAVYFGLMSLLLFGFTTLLRVARRNLKTDEYLNAMSRIRRYFVKESREIIEYVYYPHTDGKVRKKIFATGGLVLLVSVMNSLIIMALFMISWRSLEMFKLFQLSLLVLLFILIVQRYYLKRYYENGEKERTEKGMGTKFPNSIDNSEEEKL
jgi:hypothetical protein